MDIEEINVCCGCLCSGRRMIQLVEYWKKQLYLQIISEISIVQADAAVWLCWECYAHIDRLTKFKRKVKDSYCLLNDYIKLNSNSRLQGKPMLTVHKVYNIDLHDTTETDDSAFELIKTEPEELQDAHIEEEYDNALPDTNSDDEKLINISRKKKYARSKVKKKKRKQKEIEIFIEVELNEEELREERRLAMLKEDYVNAMFKCDRCIMSFPNAEDLKDHVHLKHDLNSSNLKCGVCECSFASDMAYNYHTNKHRRRYECAVCSERFSSKHGVSKHYDKVHFHRPSIEIDVQNSTHQNGGTIDKVKTTKHNKNSKKPALETFACEFCDKKFRWKASLRKHVEMHRIETGQKRKPYCEPCRLSFTNTSNLQKHVKTSSKHQIQLKLRKLIESQPLESSSSDNHQQSIEQIKCSVNSSKEQFPCPQCDKKFQWRGNLLRHLHSHVAKANGNLVCKPCDRTFSSIATYKQHMKISRKHVSENDFKYMCSDCGKRFPNKTRLKDHVDWEHLKKYNHKCSLCQKVFKSHTSLYLHKQVVHKKVNAEHLCDHCGKPYPNQAKLRYHMQALHSGQSAYKCSTCGARFSWQSCLSRHCKKLHPSHPPSRPPETDRTHND